MGIMDKIKRQPEPDNGYDANGAYGNDSDYWNNFDQQDADPQDDGGQPQDDRADMGAGVSLSGAQLELKIVHPKEFDSVTQIADHLLQHRAVVVNMEMASAETRRRLLDFLTGVTYSVGGALRKVSKDAIILTPQEVEVGDAKLRGSDGSRRADARRPRDDDEDEDDGGEDIADI